MANNWEERERERFRRNQYQQSDRDRDWNDREDSDHWSSDRSFRDTEAERRRQSGEGGRYGDRSGSYRSEEDSDWSRRARSDPSDYDYPRGGSFGGGSSRGSSSQVGGYRPGSHESYGQSNFGRSNYGRARDYGSDYGGGGYQGEFSRSRSGSSRYTGETSRGYGAGPAARDRYTGSDFESRERGFFERAGDEVASWFGDEDAERRRQRDKGQTGRGPKGYARSDERIREDVSDRLTEDRHIDASEVEVTVSSGEVTLSGTVSERFAKRHAEDIAESVAGVRHVQNNIRVKQTDYGSSSSGSAVSSTSDIGKKARSS